VNQNSPPRGIPVDSIRSDFALDPARHGQNERAIALNRKNALFAGSDGGGEHWAVVASLIETCKLIGVEPQAYLADVITKLVNGTSTARSTNCCLGPIPQHQRSGAWPENIAYA
jgi:hypothetical protein